jgi:DNA-binding SARP family transcriptional activator
MLRLRVLGSPDLEGASGSGAAAQRKSLALLALLAEAGERAVSRDRVASYLWPDADARKAFHRLSQLLHALRRNLDCPDLFVGGVDVRLNPRCITADLTEFRAASGGGTWERASSLYGGPFLDGFFLRGAPEFERWVESTRAALAREYTMALENLAIEAAGRGEVRPAAEWWRRLAETDPLSSRIAIHLMSALAACGDRAGALEHAQAYEILVQGELGAAPNPAIVALADRLRQAPPQSSALADTPRHPVTLALLPWNDVGEGRHAGFADGLLDDLATALSRTGAARVLERRSVAAVAAALHDARAIGRELGAQALLEGSIRWAGERVRVTVQLVGAMDGCYHWSEHYDRDVTDALGAQDELTERILNELRAPLRDLDRLDRAVAVGGAAGRAAP